MTSLIENYGQPQLALRKTAELMDAPNTVCDDSHGFKLFALRVRVLVGVLDQLGDSGQTELHCGPHVTRLMSKLPQHMRAEFKRFTVSLRSKKRCTNHCAVMTRARLDLKRNAAVRVRLVGAPASCKPQISLKAHQSSNRETGSHQQAARKNSTLPLLHQDTTLS